ncbi:MAG: small, acid-soluble spore protein, alpha/beta type [Clostridiaceae bacterium]|nr:small, acid-soluble spore protein, alpha/beta type [Clostridiaceae bacterium]
MTKTKKGELTPELIMKYEIAEELGLIDKVKQQGWGGLTAKETGRIGGLMTVRKKQKNKEFKDV